MKIRSLILAVFGFCGVCKKEKTIWGKCGHCGIQLCPQCKKGMTCPQCGKMKVENI